jgi:DegV family protein with EDD domain
MSNYQIITDSCIDLNKEEIVKHNLIVLPLTIEIAHVSFENDPDERVMNIKEFYEHLRNKELSHTSAVTPLCIEEKMIPYLEKGEDILCLAFSSALSTTYNSFAIAASELKEKYPQRTIYVIDTLCASSGQGLLVTKVCEMRENGCSIDEAYTWAEHNKTNLCHIFTVPDLYQLKRGGRLSAPAAAFGTLLNIKPVLHVSKEGKLVPIKKVRGRKASLDYIIKRIKETIVNPETQTIYLSHGDCYDETKELAERLKETLHIKDYRIFYVGPVIGAHSGCGTIAIFYLGNDRSNSNY